MYVSNTYVRAYACMHVRTCSRARTYCCTYDLACQRALTQVDLHQQLMIQLSGALMGIILVYEGNVERLETNRPITFLFRLSTTGFASVGKCRQKGFHEAL